MATVHVSRPPAALAAILAISSALAAQAPQPAKSSDKLWPLGTGVRAVAFSPDGGLLAATFGEPKQRGRVVLWRLADRKQLWSHAENDGVPAIAFAPDGATLAIGVYDHAAKLIDVKTGHQLKILQGHKNYVRGVAFAPDGKTLATGGWDHTVKLWDLATGKEKMTLSWPADRLYSLSYSRNGRWLLASGNHATVWDAKTGKEARTVRPYYPAATAFVDDEWFLTGGYDGTVRLWNIATGEQRLRFHGFGGVDRLAFSPQARLFAETGFAKSFALFQFGLQGPTPKEAERIRDLLVKLDDDDYDIREAAGKEMLTVGFVAEPELRRSMKEASSAEVRIRCRRLREQLLSKLWATLYGHTDQVEGLAFSPDGRLLASGSRDGTVRLWDPIAKREVSRLVAAEKE